MRKVAMICGAGGGLAGAVAEDLARAGNHVIGVDSNGDALEQQAARLASGGLAMETAVMDLANAEQIDEVCAQALEKHGVVHCLLNNTGGPKPGPLSDVADNEWREAFEMMVLGPVRVTRNLLPAMVKARFGRVVTSASSGVVTPIPSLGLSNSLRAALVGWSKTMAHEMGPQGVTFNVVVPGRIATARVRQLDEAKAAREDRPVEEVSAESAASIPVGRYGQPDEYAKLVTFLMDESSSFLTGSTYRVDGGMIPSVL